MSHLDSWPILAYYIVPIVLGLVFISGTSLIMRWVRRADDRVPECPATRALVDRRAGVR